MNYRKTSPEARDAWFKYKETYCDAGTPSVASFFAGWNAALPTQEEPECLYTMQCVACDKTFSCNIEWHGRFTCPPCEAEHWEQVRLKSRRTNCILLVTLVVGIAGILLFA